MRSAAASRSDGEEGMLIACSADGAVLAPRLPQVVEPCDDRQHDRGRHEQDGDFGGFGGLEGDGAEVDPAICAPFVRGGAANAGDDFDENQRDEGGEVDPVDDGHPEPVIDEGDGGALPEPVGGGGGGGFGPVFGSNTPTVYTPIVVQGVGGGFTRTVTIGADATGKKRPVYIER